MALKYAPETWEAMLTSEDPHDRYRAADTYLHAIGGRMISAFWIMNAAMDVIGVFELPDDMSVTTVAATIKGTGAWTDVHVYEAFSSDEFLLALNEARKHSEEFYRPGE